MQAGAAKTKEWFDLQEAAELVGICYETVRRRVTDYPKRYLSQTRGIGRTAKRYIHQSGLEKLRQEFPPELRD